MHECGHALYGQGVAPGIGTHRPGKRRQPGCARVPEPPVGKPGGALNAILEALLSAAAAGFPQLGGIPLTKFYKGINKVQPSFIRVEADEATYNLHIMLRLEIEIALLEGKVAVKDLPAVWNAKNAGIPGCHAA